MAIFAEAHWRKACCKKKAIDAGLDWTIYSDATFAYHIGEPPHILSQKVAKLNGVDICEQKARLLVKEDFARFDKIYAMATDVLEQIKIIGKEKYNAGKTDLFLNELYPGENLDLTDPWYGPESGYHEVFEVIDKTCDKIIEKFI